MSLRTIEKEVSLDSLLHKIWGHDYKHFDNPAKIGAHVRAGLEKFREECARPLRAPDWYSIPFGALYNSCVAVRHYSDIGYAELLPVDENDPL